MLEHEKITEAIIGAAIEVHKKLGPGFLESIYERALAIEFEKRGIEFSRQQEVEVYYDSQSVGMHRLDFFVQDTIVVELKTVKDISNDFYSVVRSYLKAVDRKHGLIVNFAKPKLEVKRVIR